MEEIRRSPVDIVNIPLFSGFQKHLRWLFGISSINRRISYLSTSLGSGHERLPCREQARWGPIQLGSWERELIVMRNGVPPKAFVRQELLHTLPKFNIAPERDGC